MPRVAVLFADGFETIEGLMVVDVLRRAGVGVSTVSVMESTQVTTAQQVTLTCDLTLKETDFSLYDWLVLPGGLPGTNRLKSDERVVSLVKEFFAEKNVAAICAAPSILAELGLLEGRKATVFPGCDDAFPEGSLSHEHVVVDGNLLTAQSMGYALPFALALVEQVAGRVASQKVTDTLIFD